MLFRCSRSRPTTLAVLGAALAAFAAGPSVALGQSACPDPSSLRGDMDGPLGHVAFLASDALEGRDTGSPGARCASEYIANYFRELGLTGVGPDGSFFQTFQVRAGAQLGNHNALKILDKVYELGKDWTPYGFSGTGMASAELVYGNHGLNRPGEDEATDEYARLDLGGKVVVVENGDPENPHGGSTRADPHFKASVAAGRGAAGMIVLMEEGRDLPDISAETRPAAGIPVAAVSGAVAEEIRSAARSGGQAELMAQVDPRMAEARNVVAILPGSAQGSEGEVLIIGAHYDHLGYGGDGSLAPDSREIHNGADDNASGTAALMEVARRMAVGPRPERTVLFLAFSGEEKGLLGSAAYVNAPLLPLDRSVAMLNMDMVGRLNENRLTVFGTGTAEQWNELVPEVNEGLETPFVLVPNPDGYGPSDHASFYGRGIPVLHFFTNTHSEYHRPQDDVDLINEDGLIRVAELVSGISARLAGTSPHSAIALTPIEGTPPTHGAMAAGPDSDATPSRSSGYGAYMGSIPDMGYTEGGVRVTGVRENSPAERGGLLAGDVIVEFAGAEIGDLYAYTYALRDHAPGDEVVVVVLREGERVTLNVTLGSR